MVLNNIWDNNQYKPLILSMKIKLYTKVSGFLYREKPWSRNV